MSDDDADAIPADALRSEDATIDLLVRASRLKDLGAAPDGSITLKGAGMDPITVSQAQYTTIMAQRNEKKDAKRAAEQALVPLKEREKALRKDLGRKLTWGEKNQIALTLVGR